jgi:hypothetical protein
MSRGNSFQALDNALAEAFFLGAFLFFCDVSLQNKKLALIAVIEQVASGFQSFALEAEHCAPNVDH